MNRLRIVLAFVLIIALALPAFARAPNQPNPPGKAYGAYGCCCPLTDAVVGCPATPGKFMQAGRDWMGMNPREGAKWLYGLGLIETDKVSDYLDFFCGSVWPYYPQ